LAFHVISIIFPNSPKDSYILPDPIAERNTYVTLQELEGETRKH